MFLLILIAFIEYWKPQWINEGFSQLVSVGDTALWAKWMPRRGDVGDSPTEEHSGYLRDIRYFAGYTDVQRLGVNHDFCRMIQNQSDETDMFFACALGGTEGLSSITYRTPSTKDGFQISRDDYMNEVGDGRVGYCRIVKTGTDEFQPLCNPAEDSSFKASTMVDAGPPQDSRRLLTFYDGIQFWFLFRDDMLDYAKNVTIGKMGDIHIEEFPPNPPVTKGLAFNGIDEYLRIGDSSDLSFGNVVQLRYLRAISVWVYFEEFTNNAHIFDFGNGAGNDNVFLGIMGRGNMGVQQDVLDTCTDESQKTIPLAPSGQQCVLEQSPQVAVLTSANNVELWDCPKPELFGQIVPPLHPKATKEHEATTANLIYEIWDKKQRKLHLNINHVFPLRQWVHLAITATSGDAAKPGLAIYKNGKVIHKEFSAFLPQSDTTLKNYIGKSNWMEVTSPFENEDKLFKGSLFDFRGYNKIMTEKKVQDTYAWGQQMLGLHQESSE
jgi:hypothetical protein